MYIYTYVYIYIYTHIMLAFFLTYSPGLPIPNEPIGRGWDGPCWPPTEWSADRRQLCRLALRADMALRLCNTCSLLAARCAIGPLLR